MTHEEILKEYWGHDSFRGIQKEIIESISSGHDTLGLMPTGGGKSICFQVPALAMEGVCLVITPLISLMKDQVSALRAKGIKATSVYSGQTRQEMLSALDNCVLGDYKILYLSPERLSSDIFQTKAQQMSISFICVDEAHCISQWGYDFRPSYLRIADIRKLFPKAPCLALTATATREVEEDICRKLSFREGGRTLRMSFERKNLAYVLRRTDDTTKEEEMVSILSKVEGSAIVYVRNRKKTKEIADLLNASSISATYYHAGLDSRDKDTRQEAWSTGKIRVMVATNAFGMGIDKPDVRIVLHYQSPDSPEAYFQEAGRAGRDGKKSYAVLLWDHMDAGLLKRHISESFPEKEYIRDVYENVACYLEMGVSDGYQVTREINMADFCRKFSMGSIQAYSSLQILTNAGYIHFAPDETNSSRAMFLISRNDLYNMAEDKISEEVMLALMRTYSGIFTQYQTIEESVIAKITGLDHERVYNSLKMLSNSGVISYVPAKKASRITYTVHRVERDDISLPPSIYERRKEAMAIRIRAMIDYAEKDECRQLQLLRYFSEEEAMPCGKCDICLKK